MVNAAAPARRYEKIEDRYMPAATVLLKLEEEETRRYI
jgi:hypothetical protein